MQEKDQFENARQFLGCYFHLDFGDEFGEPRIALERFIQQNDDSFRAAVVRELRQLIAVCNDQELSEVVFAFGCYYSPERHRGVAMLAWLNEVIAELERSLSG